MRDVSEVCYTSGFPTISGFRERLKSAEMHCGIVFHGIFTGGFPVKIFFWLCECASLYSYHPEPRRMGDCWGFVLLLITGNCTTSSRFFILSTFELLRCFSFYYLFNCLYFLRKKFPFASLLRYFDSSVQARASRKEAGQARWQCYNAPILFFMTPCFYWESKT